MRTIVYNITGAMAKFFGAFGLVVNPVFLALILLFLSPIWGMISDLITIPYPYYYSPVVSIAVAIYFSIYVFNNKPIYLSVKENFSIVDMALILFVIILVANNRFLRWDDGILRLYIFTISRICAPYLLGRLFVNEQIKQFIRYALPLCLLFVIGLILTELFYGPYNGESRARIFGYPAYFTVGDSVGFFLVATSVIELFYVYNSHFMKLINGFAIVSSVFVIVHMGARGMLIASLLAIFYICLFGNIIRRYLFLLLLIIISLFVSFATLPHSRTEHYENLAKFLFPFIQLTPATSNESIEIRESYVHDTIDVLKKNTILGNGTGNSDMNNKFASPHSTLLQALAELGIVGFAVFLILNIRFGMLFHRVISCRANSSSEFPVNKVVAAMWAFALLKDQFSGNYFNSIQYFFLSGLLVTTSKSVQEWRS
jgi:O-antigen ligase